jgi:hypothetical protein
MTKRNGDSSYGSQEGASSAKEIRLYHPPSSEIIRPNVTRGVVRVTACSSIGGGSSAWFIFLISLFQFAVRRQPVPPVGHAHAVLEPLPTFSVSEIQQLQPCQMPTVASADRLTAAQTVVERSQHPMKTKRVTGKDAQFAQVIKNRVDTACIRICT